MSEPDPYAGSRQTLRETVKWITTLVMGFLAVLVAGVTFTSLGKLEDSNLYYGLAAGAVAVIATLWCIRVLLGLLLSGDVSVASLMKDSTVQEAIREAGVLPGHIRSFSELETAHEMSANKFREVLAATPRNDAAIKNAHANMADLETARFHAVSYAAFLDLNNRIRGSLLKLGLGGLIVFVALGYLGFLLGTSDAGDQKKFAVQVSPGAGWEGYATALSDACGEGPHRAAGVPRRPFEGWWLATFEGPGPCAGMALPVPGNLVLMPPLR